MQEEKLLLNLKEFRSIVKCGLTENILVIIKAAMAQFDFDITPHLKPGGDNVIAVAVSNRQKDQFKIPPMAAGNFNVYGGIYRDVTIVLKNALYIPMQGSASHEGGTFVTTPAVNAKEAVVRVQTWVKNDNPAKKNLHFANHNF